MAFDFKKEYKEFYMPKNKPGIVTVPPMNYIAVRGKGDPNTEDGEYQQAINMLYGIAFTIKMSKLGDHRIAGYFDYVVPPLEGFWWQDGVVGVDYAHKENFRWISGISDACVRGAAGVYAEHHGQEAAPRDLLERRQKSGPGKTENGNPAPDPEGIIINNNRRHKVPPCRRKKGRQRKKMWK